MNRKQPVPPADIEQEIEAIDGITLADGTDLEESSVETSDPTGAWQAEPPGADTAGLDAAPQEIPSRLGAGSAGDLTGMSDEDIEAADADGADGSDIEIEDDEADPDNPRDLKDLLGEAGEDDHDRPNTHPTL